MIFIPIIAQSHNGANVVSSCNEGVQTLFREHHSYTTYIQCMAHKLNLIVVNMCKCMPVIFTLKIKNKIYLNNYYN